MNNLNLQNNPVNETQTETADKLALCESLSLPPSLPLFLSPSPLPSLSLSLVSPSLPLSLSLFLSILETFLSLLESLSLSLRVFVMSGNKTKYIVHFNKSLLIIINLLYVDLYVKQNEVKNI